MKMHLLAATAAFLLIGAAVSLSPPVSNARAESGWVTLFDGKNLDHWNQIGNANWKIEDRAVVANKGAGYLVSKESYGDFQLRVEF